MRKASKLKDEERSEIEILYEKGYSLRDIAKVLGRSPNTISEEIKRNSCGTDERTPACDRGKYIALKAKQKAYVRRKYARYQGKTIQENDELRSFIIKHLKTHLNPDEISGLMKADTSLGFYASKTAIYEWLYSEWGQQYCEHLYSQRFRPQPRPQKKTKREMIPDRTSITERPVAVESRHAAGHYEFDSVVSSKRSGSTHALAVMIERSSRMVRAKLVPSLRPQEYAQAIVSLAGELHTASFTTDNGIENKHHVAITKKTGATVFFTDPYSSWQKGSVENANKMLRRYFPKGTDFSTVSQTAVDEALTRINNKPRKILGYKSSLQVAREKGVFVRPSVLIEG
jgi:IS30 family transposase